MAPVKFPKPEVNGRNWTKSSLQGQFYKTRMCPYLTKNKNGCKRKNSCCYAHSQEELQQTVDLTKTKLCIRFENDGICPNSPCPFAHGYGELRSTNHCFKTQQCRKFNLTGTCCAGDYCRHAHGKEEAEIVAKLRRENLLSSQIHLLNFAEFLATLGIEMPESAKCRTVPFNAASPANLPQVTADTRTSSATSALDFMNISSDRIQRLDHPFMPSSHGSQASMQSDEDLIPDFFSTIEMGASQKSPNFTSGNVRVNRYGSIGPTMGAMTTTRQKSSQYLNNYPVAKLDSLTLRTTDFAPMPYPHEEYYNLSRGDSITDSQESTSLIPPPFGVTPPSIVTDKNFLFPEYSTKAMALQSRYPNNGLDHPMIVPQGIAFDPSYDPILHGTLPHQHAEMGDYIAISQEYVGPAMQIENMLQQQQQQQQQQANVSPSVGANTATALQSNYNAAFRRTPSYLSGQIGTEYYSSQEAYPPNIPMAYGGPLGSIQSMNKFAKMYNEGGCQNYVTEPARTPFILGSEFSSMELETTQDCV